MKDIQYCIFERENTLYLDLLLWNTKSDIPIELNDSFCFTFDKKKYSVKVVSIVGDEAKLKQI
jgi:hypothetical protein